MRLLYDPAAKHYEAIMEQPPPPPEEEAKEDESPRENLDESPKKKTFTYEAIYNLIQDVADNLAQAKATVDALLEQVKSPDNANETFMADMEKKVTAENERTEKMLAGLHEVCVDMCSDCCYQEVVDAQ